MKSIKNTSISVGLLNAPVKLFAMSGKEPEVGFNYCGPEGEKLKQVYVIDGTEEIVQFDNIERAYEGHKISKADLDKITEASLSDEGGNSLEQIRIQSFVPLKDVPMERVTATYLIGPNKKVSSEAFETLVAGLKKKKVAGIAKMVIRSRQKLMAIFVKDDRLYACVLSFVAQVSQIEESELRGEATIAKPLADMMGQMIDAMTEDSDMIDAQEDTFVARKRELVEAVTEGGKVETPEKPSKNQSGDLMKALEESMKKKGKVSA